MFHRVYKNNVALIIPPYIDVCPFEVRPYDTKETWPIHLFIDAPCD